MLVLGLVLAPAAWNWALALPGLVARLALYLRTAPPTALWLAPLRDILLLLEWMAGFVGATTSWRGHRLRVHSPATGRSPP
jgi:ceramide glucosyltransferase